MGLFLALAVTGSALGTGAIQAADKPITMREELITMEEFGQKLQAASGVTIEIPRPFRERKLDIFVDDLPLNRVLKGVGDALRGYWQKTDTGYRFEIETQQRNLEDRLRQLDDSQGAEEVEAFFLAADAVQELGGGKIDMQTAINWRMAKTRGMDPSSPGFQKYQKAFERMSSASYSGMSSSMTGLLIAGSMNPTERKRFLDGDVFYVSSKTSNLAKKSNFSSHIESRYGEGGVLTMVYAEPGSRSAGISITRSPFSEKLGVPMSMEGTVLFSGTWISSNPAGLEGTPYGEALKKWETEEVIKKALDYPLKGAPVIPRGDYQNGYFRACEVLKFLNRYAGLDCIAEGTRKIAFNHPLRPHTATAYETLARVFDPRFAHLHWEKTDTGAGLLVVRDAAHWRNVLEPPEKTLRWAESRVVDGKLSKEDWGTLAANLSLVDFSRLSQLAVKLPSSPDTQKWLALRLYGSLTPEQRAAPSVPLSSLSQAQRSLALQVFLRSLVRNSPSDNGIHQALVDGEFEGSGIGKLSVYLIRSEVWTQKVPYNVYENQVTSPKFPDDYEKRPIEELRLGTSAKNSVGVDI